MKKEFRGFIYNMIFYTILIVSFLILVSLLVRGQTFIVPGQCYSESITVGYNETLNQTFKYCAKNCTYLDLNFTLFPGKETFNGSNYNIDIECLDMDINQSKCVADVNLEPGQRWTRTSSVCDLEFNVDECETCEEIEYIDKKVDFRIRYSNESQRFQIDFADNQYIGQIGNNLDVSGEMFFQCPIITMNESVKVTLEQCKDIVPMYCGQTAELLIKLNNDLRKREDEAIDSFMRCNDEVEQLKKKKCLDNEEYVNTILECNIAKNDSDNCFSEKGRLEYQNESLSNSIGFWQILTMFFFGSSIVLFVIFMDKTKGLQSKLGRG